MSEFRLCYISGLCAHFTTQAIGEQWGDDWNDAPYEHNAGWPYRYVDHDRKAGKEPWELKRVYFESMLETPDTWHMNSPYSVQDINSGKVAWLGWPRHYGGEQPVNIFAGVTLDEFIRLIYAAGGTVYLPIEPK